MKTESVVITAHRQGLNWVTALVLAVLHVAAFAALFVFSWKALAITVVFYYICTGLGISMGYHRLHTHRSYKVPTWLEYFFALCGALTTHDDIRRLGARDVMTASPVTVSPDATLGQALELMERRRSQISVLPVVEAGGRAVGILRIHDIYLGIG